MRNALPGLFCIEGEYDEEIEKRKSVLPILQVLEQQEALRFVHRSAHTVAEFEHHLSRWTAQCRHFDVVYLASHGSRDGLHLSDGCDVSLERLASLVGKAGKGAVIHFGSCAVLDRPDDDLKRFLSATGARAICGYTEEVSWLDSAAFDLALLYNLATYSRAGDALNRMEAPAYAGLAKELGFSRFPRRRVAH